MATFSLTRTVRMIRVPNVLIYFAGPLWTTDVNTLPIKIYFPAFRTHNKPSKLMRKGQILLQFIQSWWQVSKHSSNKSRETSKNTEKCVQKFEKHIESIVWHIILGLKLNQLATSLDSSGIEIQQRLFQVVKVVQGSQKAQNQIWLPHGITLHQCLPKSLLHQTPLYLYTGR